jgi:hypothetical protein
LLLANLFLAKSSSSTFRTSVDQLGRVDRRVIALLPDVPHEGLVAVDIALVVEADRAEDSIELMRAQRRGDRFASTVPAFSTACAQTCTPA